MATCRDISTSEEYADFIINYAGSNDDALRIFGGECYQRISGYYGTLYKPLADIGSLSLQNHSFGSIPALYGLTERDVAANVAGLQTALEAAGILRLQNQPVVNLKGQGCIMAFVGTGINIEDEDFRYSNGDTRILRIWDMTDGTGTPPEGILYGSEYNEDDINALLRETGNEAEARKRYIGHDDINHGNVLAKMAAGNNGAAPESYIVVVKLKEAKQYLREYYFIRDGVPAYQENDIMLAVNYVRSVAMSLGMPISLCMALGTNSRGHDGSSALSYIMDTFASGTGAAVTVSGGSEGNKQLHASGTVTEDDSPKDIQFRVDERQQGLMINIWGNNPEIFSVGLLSPTGEAIPKIPVRLGKSETYKLIFDPTTVLVEYDFVEGDSGDELILIRLDRPTAGAWTIRLYGDNVLSGRYNAYLPISEFIYDNTEFLEPDPDITLVDPAYSRQSITTVSYNPATNALYVGNGRGFARNGAIKPDLATPLSVAVTAGAACQFLNWGVVNENDMQMRGSDIKSYLIRGAERSDTIRYPSREWGYGVVNVYEAFERLRGV